MVALDQGTWNLVFGWIMRKRCFLPEGCSPPAEGIVIYLLIFLALVTLFYITYLYSQGEKIWKR